MSNINDIVQQYKDELTQWWILTDQPESQKREALELQAVLWHEEARVKAAFAEVCLSILELPPILLPEVPQVDTSPGQDPPT